MERISWKYDKINEAISKLKAYSSLFQVYRDIIDQKQKEYWIFTWYILSKLN